MIHVRDSLIMLRVASRGVAVASRGAAAAAAAAIGSRRATCTEGPVSIHSLGGTSLDGGRELSFACLAGKPALVLNVASE